MVGGIYHEDEAFIHIHFCDTMQQAESFKIKYDYAVVLKRPSGLVITYHNDKNIRMLNTGSRDIEELKRSLWRDFQEQHIPGEVFMDDFVPEGLGTAFSLDNVDKISNAEDLWKQVSADIDSRGADGGDRINLIDIKKRVCILGHSAS